MQFTIEVPDVERARTFYRNVFGWEFDSGRIRGASPAGEITAGDQPRIVPAFAVPAVAAAVAAARRDGSAVRTGHGASVTDGDGVSFEVREGRTDVRCGVGDLFYFVVPVASEAGREFRAAVLGWEFTPGSHPGGWNIVNTAPPGGLFVGGTGAPSLYFRVDDVAAGRERVVAAGGTAGQRQPNSAGEHVDCVDDQGVAFSIGSVREV